MLYRIVMQTIQMPLEIHIIPNCVLPKPTLPNIPFSVLATRYRNRLW